MKQQKTIAKSGPVAHLRVCDRLLGLNLILILASGIQLETTSGRYAWSVWVHIVLGTLLVGLSVYHIYLHYKSSNWFARFAKNPNATTRVLWWIFLLTAVSGIAATVEWLVEGGHSPIGGVHGKIGFVMVLFGIVHAVRQIRKQKNAKSRR